MPENEVDVIRSWILQRWNGCKGDHADDARSVQEAGWKIPFHVCQGTCECRGFRRFPEMNDPEYGSKDISDRRWPFIAQGEESRQVPGSCAGSSGVVLPAAVLTGTQSR